ncbi:UNVERIFIED_CONTAM: hypothetical protein GTU68_028197 [Idotea baltica]|nr:hypothetical protein [Idotea baltica]
MILSSIVAFDKNQLIGVNNTIPWYLPHDLKYFKKTTTGHHIIMGRKNHDSIGKLLPNRTNIIISRNKNYTVIGGVVVHNLEAGITLAKINEDNEAFIIGGASIYALAQNKIEKLYVTHLETEIITNNDNHNVYYPEIDWSKWNIIQEEKVTKDKKNPIDRHYVIYEKKQKI